MTDSDAAAALPDGTYDVFIVDAMLDHDDGVASLELAVVSGPSKGEVIRLRMKSGGRDPVGVIGMPGTLTVSGGQPSLRIDT